MPSTYTVHRRLVLRISRPRWNRLDANRADFEEVGILAPMDSDRLAHLCVGELERRPPLGFASRLGEQSAAFEAFRDDVAGSEQSLKNFVDRRRAFLLK